MNPADSFCRICANNFESKLEDDLFSKFNKRLLQQIKELTGITLKSNCRQNLPRHICTTCKQDLFKAYEFRYAFLKAQNYFKSKDYKEKIGNDAKENLATQTAQMFDTVFVAIKEEYVENYDDTVLTHVEANESKVENNDDVSPSMDIIIKPDIKVDIDLDYTGLDNTEEENDDMEEDPCFEAAFPDSSSSEDFEKKKTKKLVKPKTEAKKRTRKLKEKKLRQPPGEKLYKCHHCDLQFKRPNTRTKHERLLHGRDWPFQCEECGKKFTTHEAGRNHMVVHTKIRNFHCTICKSSFLLRKHLITHYRSETHKNNEKKMLESGDMKTEETAHSSQALPIPPEKMVALSADKMSEVT